MRILVKKVKLLKSPKETCSIDFNHNPASSIIDASLTNVVGKNMGRFQHGMIMNGVFQIGCVIAEYLHRSLNE